VCADTPDKNIIAVSHFPIFSREQKEWDCPTMEEEPNAKGVPAHAVPSSTPTIPDHGSQYQVLVLGDGNCKASSKPGPESTQAVQSEAK